MTLNQKLYTKCRNQLLNESSYASTLQLASSVILLLHLLFFFQLKNTEFKSIIPLIKIFQHKTWQNWKEEKDSIISKYVPDLTLEETQTLKQLSIVTMAQNNSFLSFSQLSKQLDIPSHVDLESLLIKSIYSGYVDGKIDHKHHCLVIREAKPRNTGDIDQIISQVDSLLSSCDTVLGNLEDMIQKSQDSLERETESDLEFLQAKTSAPKS